MNKMEREIKKLLEEYAALVEEATELARKLKSDGFVNDVAIRPIKNSLELLRLELDYRKNEEALKEFDVQMNHSDLFSKVDAIDIILNKLPDKHSSSVRAFLTGLSS